MKNGAITLLDILGWSGIWKTDQKAHLKLNLIISSFKDLKQDMLKDPEKYVYDHPHKEYLLENFYTQDLEIISISDTIALCTEGTINFAIEWQGIFISALMETFIILNNSLLRGATSYGSFDFVENILIGPAVDEAAAWYNLANWAGVIQTPSALFNNPKPNYRLWIEYDVPLKSNRKFKTLASNWCRSFLKSENKFYLYKLFLKNQPIIPELYEKYINTYDFLEYCEKNG